MEISKLLLSPIVRFPNSTNPLLLTRDEKDTKQSKEEMSREFVHRFGMLKGQRLYDQAERLTVKAETVRANLENAAVNTAVEEDEFTLPKSSDSYEMVVPPRNSQAKLVSSFVFEFFDLLIRFVLIWKKISSGFRSLSNQRYHLI